WGFLYDGSAGLLNAGLDAIGLGGWTRPWLGTASTALPALLAIGFPWAGGLSLLVYLAGLGAIEPQIHDAAALDGAVGWRRMLHVDVPLVRPQIGLLATLATIGALQDFGTILVLTGGGPGLATHVPALHMYFQAFRFGHLGYASAIGFVLFAAILACTAIGRRTGARQGGAA
ncbi:MAG: carbohydrate ABC transporter permease, partial [Armatimonadota bacterium]